MIENTGNNSKKSDKWRITYNAKFTLSFCLISFIMLLLNMGTGGWVNNVFSLSPHLGFTSSYRLVSYIFCHANFEHLVGNYFFLLMLGPILEEKFGSKLLALMTVITAVATGLVNALVFDSGIIGASGIVFMFIVLASIVNMKSKEVPLTFIFIVLIYIGGEIVNSFNNDNISQFGHIFGGICGGGLGYFFNKESKMN